MEGTARIWFTSQQRAELWERWKALLAFRRRRGAAPIWSIHGRFSSHTYIRAKSRRIRW